MNHWVGFYIAVAVALWAGASGADILAGNAEEVDVQLVLAADISGSMSAVLLDKQRKGFAAAFRDRSLQQAIRSGPVGRIAVTYFEWAGKSEQRVIVPWMVLSDPEDIARFANRLESAPAERSGGDTSISAAILFAQNLLQKSGFASK